MIPITPHDDKFIMRGDMIQGGAKMPALLRYLPTLRHTDFTYVGTVFGSGAWAVAESCAALGFGSTLFLSKSDFTPHWLNRAKDIGATIEWFDPFPVSLMHEALIEANAGINDTYILPLGFDTPDFIEAMASVLKESVPSQPPEIWVSAISGVLARAACLAFPDTPIHAVSPVKHTGDCGHATLHKAEGKFHRPPEAMPPYPSCPFSDAKTWEIAHKQAIKGAIIINVSG